MGRHAGPIFKKSRRYGISLLETGKEFAKGKQRTTAAKPGARKPKLSEYGVHLYEKQKLRYIYGVNERQFRRLFEIARKAKSVTGLTFLQILERRLDNVVYRAGFAATRKQARQLVSHNFFQVQGKNVNIASYLVNVNDVITLKPKAHTLSVVLEAKAARPVAAWLKVKDFQIAVERLPQRNEINPEINEALVVEFY